MKCTSSTQVLVIKPNGTRVCENKTGDELNCKVFDEPKTNCTMCNDNSYKSY